MWSPVTQNREFHPGPSRWGPVLLLTCGLLLLDDSAWAQSVSGVRGMNGGVGALFSLVGPGNLYVDNQGTQGYMYNFGNNVESFNFRTAGGQQWSGGIMTLGPQLSIGLIQGSNQVGSPVIFPRAPRLTTPLPPVQSSILDDLSEDTILP